MDPRVHWDHAKTLFFEHYPSLYSTAFLCCLYLDCLDITLFVTINLSAVCHPWLIFPNAIGPLDEAIVKGNKPGTGPAKARSDQPEFFDLKKKKEKVTVSDGTSTGM